MNNVVNLDDYRKTELYIAPETHRYEAIPFFWSSFFVAWAMGFLFASKLVLGRR